jgi:hypothetical protein
MFKIENKGIKLTVMFLGTLQHVFIKRNHYTCNSRLSFREGLMWEIRIFGVKVVWSSCGSDGDGKHWSMIPQLRQP